MEFDHSLTHELLLYALIDGFLCGAVYDIFRLFRAFSLKNRIIVFFEDVLFCLIFALSLEVLFYNFSYGRIRLYAILGAIFGFSVYYFTVGKITYSICLKVKKLFMKLAGIVFGRVKTSTVGIYCRIYSKAAMKNHVRKARKGFGI